MATGELYRKTGPKISSQKNEARRDYVREYKRQELKNDPDKVRARASKYYHANKDKLRAQQNKYLKDRVDGLRNEVFNLLGCKCAKCGFEDIRALQIDHINGEGNKDRKSKGNNSIKYYMSIIISVQEKKNEFQILCANCNWIKRIEEKEQIKNTQLCQQ